MNQSLPLILAEQGDISVFRSLEALEGYIEPVDVRNGIYEIFDAEGRRLFATIERPLKGRLAWLFGLPAEHVTLGFVVGAAEPDRLSEIVRSFLVRLGGDATTLLELSLQQLVAELVSRTGYVDT